MKNPDEFTIRDYIFRETVSCPLKLSFLQQENYNDQRDDLFRRKTKRNLRESLARQFPNIHYTSNSADVAAEETLSWLKEDVVSICGAVVHHQSIRARIPVLLKDGEKLTIIQVHGKVLKGNPESLFNRSPIGKSLKRYMVKASYRYFVLKSLYPQAEIRCTFMFPKKSFTSQSDRLYQRTQGVMNIDNDALEELKKLFVQVDGTRRVVEMVESIPSDVSHPWFTGDSIAEAIRKVNALQKNDAEGIVENVHLGCRNCSFRKPVNQHENGCWDIHFPDANIQNRDKHLFELIGHHVQEQHLHEEKYQEQVSYSRDLSDAGKVIRHTNQKIAIYHRKAMQLLDAKNQKIPLIFAKQLLNRLTEIPYPHHFIDFEAATHPVPAEKGRRPYDPLLFQFSCHSLRHDGTLVHTQWLDEEDSESPHIDLIDGLAKVPDLDKGTIIQFSPFERQVFYKLFNELRQRRSEFKVRFKFLENVLGIKDRAGENRFLDISVLLKDGYYNRFMNNGLSLKEILYSVLQVEDQMRTFKTDTYTIEGIDVHLFKKKNGRIIDPYYQLSDDRSRIRDGVTAMHAYLSMKAGSLNSTQQELVPKQLKRYCSIDSLGLYLIYKHLVHLMQINKSDGDLVIEG